MIKKILVFGAGYVGASLGVLLAQKYKVVFVDKDSEKVSKINKMQAPILEFQLQEYLSQYKHNISATTSFIDHLESSDLIILALPTNYDETRSTFDTSILEDVLAKLNNSLFKKSVVIKSTVYIGFTEAVKRKFPNLDIIFIPEFLREGKAIEDNCNPSRIVIGAEEIESNNLASVFLSIAKNLPKVLYMSSKEAEAAKLFANTYLAIRVSFFNELDSFALAKELNARSIIDGVSSDPRIGEYYNNPSFGYGGYCLPKDTKQLLANFDSIPQKLFSAVIESNQLRKNFIVDSVLSHRPKIVGVYRLIMKKNSDNFREASIFDIMEIIQEKGIKIIIYEPMLHDGLSNFKIVNDLQLFKKSADIILANRLDEDLSDIEAKVFTRDIYGNN